MGKVFLIIILFVPTIKMAQIALPTFQGVHKPQSHTANGQLNYEVHTSPSSYYASTYSQIISNQGSLETSGTTSDSWWAINLRLWTHKFYFPITFRICNRRCF